MNGWRTPPRQPFMNLLHPYKEQAEIELRREKAVEKPKILLDSASHKLYYVNYKIGLNLPPCTRNPAVSCDFPCPFSSYFLSAVFDGCCWASS